MMSLRRICAGLLVLSASLAYGNAEKEHLKFYAPFEDSVKPEIALAGSGLQSAGKMIFTEGKYGKALHFPRESEVGDLLYNLGKIMAGKEWSIGVWIRLEERIQQGRPGVGQNLFRTNLAWKSGNLYAGFNRWGHFIFQHFDADGKSHGAVLSAAVFPLREWIHLTFAYRNGRHAVYLNGIEAAYTENSDILKPGAVQTILRIGSLDFRRGDQFGGAVDELKIFDKFLTPEEARAIMESTPGREQEEVVLFAPFEGEVDPEGAAGGFSATELLFSKGKSGDGVKVMRHGYDRRGTLVLNGIRNLGGKAVSVIFHFIPDWDGASDQAVHGLFHAAAGNLEYGLVKRGKEIQFTLERNGVKQKIALPSALLKKNTASRIAAGFDFTAGRVFLSIDGEKAEERLTLPAANPQAAGTMRIGDVPGADNYSQTQAEGVIDELLAVNAFHSPEELADLQEAKSKKAAARQKCTIAVTPVKEQEKPLWDLNGAEKVTTPTREKITLNALWRMQLTGNGLSFDPSAWSYLAVPGRYSGQGNGRTDCEFYLRDAGLKKLPRNAPYQGKDPYTFVDSYFERAFFVPENWKNRQIVLLLDELSRSEKGTVYLNGKEIAKLNQGIFFEIPLREESLRFGEYNYLTIHAVDDGYYWAWRGIKGDTWISVKPQISLEYPFVTTSVKEKKVVFEASVRNTSGKSETVLVEAEIKGSNAPAPASSRPTEIKGGETKKIVFEVPWDNASLWSPDSPCLYSCLFSLKNAEGKALDILPPVRFGFREFEIRGKDYYLNGKKIHLFTHSEWFNSSIVLDEARRWARTLKQLGYNSVRINFPAKDEYPENIMQACDEEGILQLVGIEGVSSREYTLWNDPEIRKNLEERMAAMIRRWRNHPSNVMYFLSINFLGYPWDFHPLKLADGYVSKMKQGKYLISLEGVKIMRKYDPVRPYFFQAGGNFGEVITTNAYFCWWPQAERNAWPAVWSKIGKKPLHIVETGFPYARSFYGIDVKYSGEKPLFYYENLARYYGPSVYLDEDQEMIRSVALSTRGRERADLYHDAPFLQKLHCDLLRETIPYWRGFDSSGICPFEELHYAFQKNAPHHTKHTSKEWTVPVEDFRRAGWHADLRKLTYQADIDPEKPLPFADALKEVFSPLLVFLDGGEPEPVDQTHSYYSRGTLEKRIVLVNDTSAEAKISGQWSFLAQSGRFEETLKPGEIRRLPLRISLPAVTERKTCSLVVAPENQKPISFEVTIFPEIEADFPRGIALYDPKGVTAKALERLNIKTADASRLGSLEGIRLLLIGRESLTPEFSSIARKLKLKDFVDSGKCNVIVFEQQPEGLALLGLKTENVYARDVFSGNGFALPGLNEADYSKWAGDGTLAPAKQPPEPQTENNAPVALWHWNNANIVSSYPIRRPEKGDFRVLLSCGKDLVYTPLIEWKSGEGRLLFCQLEIFGRTRREPAAEHAAAELIKRYAELEPPAERPRLLHPGTIRAGEVEGLRKEVENGAVLMVPPGNVELFGVTRTPREVGRFLITDAGRRYWRHFTARDCYLRAPQEVGILSGRDLIPLTDPAFAAEQKLGRGKVIFLEIPSDPQKEERERGLRQGKDSSTFWSAEILAERFRQMENLVEAACGKEFPSLAERFEKMRLPMPVFSLNGEWQLRTDPGRVGLKESWHKPGNDAIENGWEKVPVPGLFIYHLPKIGNFTGIVWYRKVVDLPKEFRGKELFLDLGSIDDLDDTYVNGVLIGHTGEDTEGYWSTRRLYRIPREQTRNARLHIAIRIENLRGDGGILGYARIVDSSQKDADDPFPYAKDPALYNTESHNRW